MGYADDLSTNPLHGKRDSISQNQSHIILAYLSFFSDSSEDFHALWVLVEDLDRRDAEVTFTHHLSFDVAVGAYCPSDDGLTGFRLHRCCRNGANTLE